MRDQYSSTSSRTAFHAARKSALSVKKACRRPQLLALARCHGSSSSFLGLTWCLCLANSRPEGCGNRVELVHPSGSDHGRHGGGSRERSRLSPSGSPATARRPRTTATSEPAATARRPSQQVQSSASERPRAGGPKQRHGLAHRALGGSARSPVRTAPESARRGRPRPWPKGSGRSAGRVVRVRRRHVALPTGPADRAGWPPALEARCVPAAHGAELFGVLGEIVSDELLPLVGSSGWTVERGPIALCSAPSRARPGSVETISRTLPGITGGSQTRSGSRLGLPAGSGRREPARRGPRPPP